MDGHRKNKSHVIRETEKTDGEAALRRSWVRKNTVEVEVEKRLVNKILTLALTQRLTICELLSQTVSVPGGPWEERGLELLVYLGQRPACREVRTSNFEQKYLPSIELVESKARLPRSLGTWKGQFQGCGEVGILTHSCYKCKFMQVSHRGNLGIRSESFRNVPLTWQFYFWAFILRK